MAQLRKGQRGTTPSLVPAMPKAAEALFEQLDKALKGPEGDEIQGKTKASSGTAHRQDVLGRVSAGLKQVHSGSEPVQGLIVFDVDKEKWALDLREGTRSVTKGAPSDKPDLTLTITDDNFVKLVNGKLGPQQVWHLLTSYSSRTSLPCCSCAR